MLSTNDKKQAQAITVGMMAPDFTVPRSAGGELSLRSLRGKKVILYFYPKDNTPGCTREAIAFRDAQAELDQLGVVVLGLSKDSLKSHQGFCEKHALSFPLLSDPEGKVIAAYEAFKPAKEGAPAKGILRSTFLIDEKGVIRHIWRKVKVEGHKEEVIQAILALK